MTKKTIMIVSGFACFVLGACFALYKNKDGLKALLDRDGEEPDR